MEDLFSAIGKGLRRVRNDAPVPYVGTRSNAAFGGIFGSPDIPDAERAFDAFGSVGTLFAIVSQIGNAFASVPWHLYKRTSVRDQSRRTEVLNSGFMYVWDKPNEFMTGRRFREATQQHLDLVGECCIVLNIVGNIVLEMWPVRPDRIEPIKHPTKFLTGYVYHGPEGEEVPLGKDQVIRIMYPNPRDPYRGMGPVQAVLADIDAARYSAEWNRNFFINGARPGGIIEVDRKMSDKEFIEFQSRWRQQHQGVANAHRVAVLENAKWKDVSFSMTDMQFAELRDLSRELIREAFAFPKPMLGTVDDVNRANAEAGKEIMAEGQTIPRLNRWKDEINTFLLPRFANGSTLVIDYEDPTPINNELANAIRNSKTTSAANLVKAGYHPDDVAEAMELPAMQWVGIPAAPTPAPKEEGTDANGSAITGRRKPLIGVLERGWSE